MAIVTRHTYGKLCSELNLKFDLQKGAFLNTVFPEEHFFYTFNSRERRYLFIYSSILQDEESFKLKYYQNVPEKEDHFNYVHENVGKSNYHLFEDCPMLMKDFEDFLIPHQIKKLQKAEAIREFRDWFDQNDFTRRYLMNEISSVQIVEKYNQTFPLKFGVEELDERFNFHVKVPNSGISIVEEEFDFDAFKQNVEEFKVRFDMEFSSNDWRELSKYSRSLNSIDLQKQLEEISNRFPEAKLRERFSDDFLVKKLNSAFELKTQMISLLLKYLRWSFNFHIKEFNPTTLEDFGLKCCSFCDEKKKEELLK